MVVAYFTGQHRPNKSLLLKQECKVLKTLICDLSR